MEAATVADVMHSGVVTCPPDTSLRAVAQLLGQHAIHAVVVAGDKAAPIGIVTDRDVLFAHATGKLDATRARDAATEPTITVRPNLDLRDASELMTRHGTTHVVVTERGDRRPIGIVSSLDIARAVGRS